MNYDGLEATYWRRQIDRVEQLRSKIASRANSTPGRVVPDDSDLALGSGRRISATVLFLDISAFSQRRSISADEQELMLRVLNLFLTEMIRVVEDYSGYVEKNTGDGLMAYFEEGAIGSPEQNSTKRAVSCALTMSAANDELITPILRATGVPPIQFRVSIEHGYITVARIGAPGRFNSNVAIGNPANFAAKLLYSVQPGDIALGANARSRLPAFWQLTWTELSPVSTGWTYSNTGLPYPLYLYTGRWIRLI